MAKRTIEADVPNEDELGPWLARNWGILADIDPELLDLIEGRGGATANPSPSAMPGEDMTRSEPPIPRSE